LSGIEAGLPVSRNIGAIAVRLSRQSTVDPAAEQRKRWGALAGTVGIVLVVLAAALLDAASVSWAHGLPPAVAGLFGRITRFGQSDWLLIPTGVFTIILLASAWRRVPLLMRSAWAEIGGLVGYFFVAVAVGGLITDLVKWIVGRSRPPLFLSEGILGFHPLSTGYLHVSFPSGHATTAAAATVVVALISRRAALAVGVLAAAIAVSRVAVGAHYPSDVIAGAFIGAGYSYWLADRLAGKRFIFRRDRAGRIRARAGAIRRVFAKRGGAGAMAIALAVAAHVADPSPRPSPQKGEGDRPP
jgi:undecaprenyl-diphosphatase